MSTLVPKISWRYKAACRKDGMVDIFYPPPEVEKRREKQMRENRAKKICEECPVMEACLDHAVRYGETQGVWGGKSETELKNLQKERSGKDSPKARR